MKIVYSENAYDNIRGDWIWSSVRILNVHEFLTNKN
jgi:hypothetical protein